LEVALNGQQFVKTGQIFVFEVDKKAIKKKVVAGK